MAPAFEHRQAAAARAIATPAAESDRRADG
jgi:hypothetical protein